MALPLFLTDHGLPAGANRLPPSTSTALSAQTDQEAVAAWLAIFHDSPHTLGNARKEVERLWLWASQERGRALSALTHEDLIAYQAFLADPQPRARWVATGHYARQHPAWRPFTQRDPSRPPLSKASQRQALIVLDSLFRWLVEAGYLINNPLQLSRRNWRKTRVAAAPPNNSLLLDTGVAGRWLTPDEWQLVGAAIAAIPRESLRDHAHYHRCRWLMALLYLAELRISEVANTTMGQFLAQQQEGRERWWLVVRGKGGVVRNVVVVPDLLDELLLYREAVGLPRWPSPQETTPLVMRVTGTQSMSPSPLSISAIHKIVKEVFKRAERHCAAAGNPGLALRLTQASAHWLRHSGASHLLEAGVAITDVRDQLGHASIVTTNTYIHSAELRRHDNLSRHHGLGWDEEST